MSSNLHMPIRRTKKLCNVLVLAVKRILQFREFLTLGYWHEVKSLTAALGKFSRLS